MPTDASYSITDLARLTGLNVRTIRYYLAQGLIPASGESGPGAHYGDGHLERLRLVRRLQQQHLPLAEIRTRLAALTDSEVAQLASIETPRLAEPETTALDYVRAVLAGSQRTVPPAPAAMSPVRGAPSGGGRALRRMAPPFSTELRRAASEPALPLTTAALPPSLAPDAGAATAHAGAAAADAGAAEPVNTIERSQWERLSLGPDLELHVRRPLGRLEQKRVERLITIARQVLKEEQP